MLGQVEKLSRGGFSWSETCLLTVQLAVNVRPNSVENKAFKQLVCLAQERDRSKVLGFVRVLSWLEDSDDFGSEPLFWDTGVLDAVIKHV